MVVLRSRTLRSTSESAEWAGYDGAKRKRGSKLHMALDTLGHGLALRVTPGSADDRTATVQAATGESVGLAYVEKGYTGQRAERATATYGIDLEVVKLPDAKRGFVLLPRRWVLV